jgi:hypothetical protein
LSSLIQEVSEKLGKGALSPKLESVAVLVCCSHAVRALHILTSGEANFRVDFLSGEIVLLGALHGIPTPCNRLLQKVANRVGRDRKPPGSMKIEELKLMLDTSEAI